MLSELGAWAASGRKASLWWRDDDAREPTAALERLIALSEELDVPVALAVIPAIATSALARRVATCRHIQVVQHGYAHANHVPAAASKMELGYRRTGAIVQELQKGRTIETPHGHVVHLDIRHVGEKVIDAKLPFVRELDKIYGLNISALLLDAIQTRLA